MNKDVEKLQELIEAAGPQSIVFFGGAGVSTESGIPDFRSEDGLYRQKFKYPPEYMLSRSCFDQHTKDFFEFYYAKVLFFDAQPNAAHKKLAQLENEGKLISVVTQNIDGLHQRAGSKAVFELHGSILRNYCMSCNHFATGEEMLELRGEDGIPHCPECGGTMKPDVVLYEEPLNSAVTRDAIESISRAEILIVAGTSLVVYPAAGLIDDFNGKELIIINKQATSADRKADLVIKEKVGEVLNFG